MLPVTCMPAPMVETSSLLGSGRAVSVFAMPLMGLPSDFDPEK
jgi:hypothetical protein